MIATHATIEKPIVVIEFDEHDAHMILEALDGCLELPAALDTNETLARLHAAMAGLVNP